MKTKEAEQHFNGVSGLAAALKLTPAAISQWGEYPPDKRQLQIERIAPELKAEPGCMERVLGLPVEPWDGKTDRRKRVRRKANHKKAGKK
jgi:hypothetical protein